MVKSELFEHPPSKPINATVTHMSNDGSLGQQSQNAAGRPHVVKVLVGLPFAVDFRVGILYGLLQRVRR